MVKVNWTDLATEKKTSPVATPSTLLTRLRSNTAAVCQVHQVNKVYSSVFFILKKKSDSVLMGNEKKFCTIFMTGMS